MKVKINDVIYDSVNQPIMVILSDADKTNIANMHEIATKYCSFPDGVPVGIIEEWMKTGDIK